MYVKQFGFDLVKTDVRVTSGQGRSVTAAATGMSMGQADFTGHTEPKPPSNRCPRVLGLPIHAGPEP